MRLQTYFGRAGGEEEGQQQADAQDAACLEHMAQPGPPHQGHWQPVVHCLPCGELYWRQTQGEVHCTIITLKPSQAGERAQGHVVAGEVMTCGGQCSLRELPYRALEQAPLGYQHALSCPQEVNDQHL